MKEIVYLTERCIVSCMHLGCIHHIRHSHMLNHKLLAFPFSFQQYLPLQPRLSQTTQTPNYDKNENKNVIRLCAWNVKRDRFSLDSSSLKLQLQIKLKLNEFRHELQIKSQLKTHQNFHCKKTKTQIEWKRKNGKKTSRKSTQKDWRLLEEKLNEVILRRVLTWN